jgi:hypothetical protein
LFHYIQVIGGNKYREGYRYKITNLNEENTLNKSIEEALKKTLETIKAEHERETSEPVGQNAVSNSKNSINTEKKSRTTTQLRIKN